MLLLLPFPHGISGEERRASALRKLWPEGPQRRREAQPGEAKAASIWLGGGRRGGRKNSWRGENKQGECREESGALAYIRKHSVYQNSGPKKSRSCQNNEYRRGAFTAGAAVQFYLQYLLSAREQHAACQFPKARTACSFPQVDVYSRQGEFFFFFLFSSAKQKLIRSQNSCNVHTPAGRGRRRRAAIEYVNSSRLILLCESPGKCHPTSELIITGLRKKTTMACCLL